MLDPKETFATGRASLLHILGVLGFESPCLFSGFFLLLGDGGAYKRILEKGWFMYDEIYGNIRKKNE